MDCMVLVFTMQFKGIYFYVREGRGRSFAGGGSFRVGGFGICGKEVVFRVSCQFGIRFYLRSGGRRAFVVFVTFFFRFRRFWTWVFNFSESVVKYRRNSSCRFGVGVCVTCLVFLSILYMAVVFFIGYIRECIFFSNVFDVLFFSFYSCCVFRQYVFFIFRFVG